MDWLIIVIVTVATALVLFVVYKMQQRRLRRRFRLEIANQGNVRSRYRLRAEDSGALQFRFMLDGDELPLGERRPKGVADTPDGMQAVSSTTLAGAGGDSSGQKSRAPAQRLNQASGLTALAADMLLALGSLLPNSAGGPLLRRANQLRMGRIRMAQAQRVSHQVAGLGGSVQPAAKGHTPTGTAPAVSAAAPLQALAGEAYAETPFVRPGETLALDLLVTGDYTPRPQQRSFRILSGSVEDEDAPLVIEEGEVRIGGGFWGHRSLPYVAVVATGVVILLLALWISGTGAPF